MIEKKKIISELRNVLNRNSSVADIWLYGSLDDKISDLDLLILYKKKPKKVQLPNFLKKMVADGTVIYIPRKFAKDIFLFEDLRVYSIRDKKKILPKLSKQILKFRSLTSFLERYYERRSKLLSIKSISPVSLRIIKSVIFSYLNFNSFNNSDKTHNLLKKYKKIREKFSLNKLNKKMLINYLKNFKKNDHIFYLQSIQILNKIFEPKINIFLNYKFNNYTRYSLNKKKNCIIVPYILGYIYKFYSSKNLLISRKIKSDFKSNIKLDKKNYFLHLYLKRKINFLNNAYRDLKKEKFKSGLYRLSWYLSN